MVPGRGIEPLIFRVWAERLAHSTTPAKIFNYQRTANPFVNFTVRELFKYIFPIRTKYSRKATKSKKASHYLRGCSTKFYFICLGYSKAESPAREPAVVPFVAFPFTVTIKYIECFTYLLIVIKLKQSGMLSHHQPYTYNCPNCTNLTLLTYLAELCLSTYSDLHRLTFQLRVARHPCCRLAFSFIFKYRLSTPLHVVISPFFDIWRQSSFLY